VASDPTPDAGPPADDRLSTIDAEVVRPCLALAFRPGELLSFTTARTGDTPDIEVRLETSAGDVQTLPVWQPGVESLATVAGMRRNLLWQLEYWLPESGLRWGQEVRLVVPDGWE
jgi:hypothetical protein